MQSIAHSLCRHVDTVKRFVADPSPRKKWSGSGVMKAVTTWELRRHVKQKLLKKSGQTSKTIFT